MIPYPVLEAKVLEKHGLKNGECQVIGGITVCQEKMLYGKNRFMRRIILEPYTRTIHHFEGSWIGEEARNRNLQVEKDLELCQ